LRAFIDRRFTCVNFLGYDATEKQLVDRIVMNFLPSILVQAAFVDRPQLRSDLNRVVDLIEEKFSVMKKREGM
jgi:hypothetical protein